MQTRIISEYEKQRMELYKRYTGILSMCKSSSSRIFVPNLLSLERCDSRQWSQTWQFKLKWCRKKNTVFFKTKGHLSRLAWPTQRDGLSCLASPRLALRCAAWPSKTNPDPCSRPVATSGCSYRYYNGIVHNAKCIDVAFFSVRQAMFLYNNDCLM